MKRYGGHIRNPEREHASREDWFNGVEAVVVERDTAAMAVKVVIPAIDEKRVYDEWVSLLTPFAGPSGYGACFMPGEGAEVVLFSRFNEGLTLYAVPRFNEEFLPPAEFADGSHGLKTDRELKLLADQLISIVGQMDVLVRAATTARVEAPDVFLHSGAQVSVHGQGQKVGFLGAAPAVRQALPDPANDIGSVIALANAMRSLLITFGFAQ